jgi:trimethylamine---corrinoid protein Co-methyltransferase
MHAAGHAYSVLNPAEMDTIHRGAMRILGEMGMQIEHAGLLSVLAEAGFMVDFQAQRVRFPTALVERFLAEADKHDWENSKPRLGATAGLYHGRFHDPESGELVAWDEQRMAYYFRLARRLPNVGSALMLGCRLENAGTLEPLYERLMCWKYGAQEGSSIYLDELCPYLYDFYQARASALDKPVADVFRGTVYLVPAMKLGRHEAHQVAYFREHGLKVGIGGMMAMGANAPVTLAGAATLNLAEQLALRMLDWAWFGEKRLHLGGSISVMDMRTMIYPYGRPEMALANMLLAQMARYYGASCSGHAGLSDAKLPSVEAGYQKALTAIPTLLACGSLWMDAGLLSIDEICSPVQLVLDNEFLGALRRFTVELAVDEESIGIETILATGPGGHYLDKDHTVRYLRAEHWQPSIWSQEMLMPWLEGPRKLDADRARDIALTIRAEPEETFMEADLERDLLGIISRAQKTLG